MSPEERASRLFDRVMRLAEEGRQDSVQFFLPMALGAYGQLPALDLDAHFHVGLLAAAGGDQGTTRAEADTIARAVATHLFSAILRERAAELAGDQRGERRAYQDFLTHERAERRLARPEYADHAPLLDDFHDAALKATGAKP